MEPPIIEPIIVPIVNGIKVFFLMSLKKIIVLPRLEPIWTIPCIGNNATGGSLTANNPNKIAPPPIPKADVMNEVVMLAKIRKYDVRFEIDSGKSNILFFESVRRWSKVTWHFTN